MKVRIAYTTLLLFFCKFFIFPLYAQETAIRLEWANAPVSVNESFVLTVVIEGSPEREVSGFPTIPGFLKRGTTVTSSTSTIAGKTTTVHRISQTYLPTREGTFRVEAFMMTVNGAPLRSTGFSVVVAQPDPTPTRTDDTDDALPAELSSVPDLDNDTPAEALLSLRAGPQRVFVGQGFTVRLSVLVAASNAVQLNFYELDAQLSELIRQLRPANCWEENFGIRGEPQEYQLRINGKPYVEYRLFEAVYFPLTAQPIVFPALELRLLEGEGTAQRSRAFRSQPVTVRPRPLPDHPLRDRVSVGTFQLRETLSNSAGRTGQSVTYTLRVVGEGNLAAVQLEVPPGDAQFDFYPPDVQQAITHRNGRVSGEKIFRFQLIPKRAGRFPLSPYFRWTYFNHRTQRYQTLTSRLALTVSGETVVDGTPSGPETSTLYQGLERLDTSGTFVDYPILIKGLANALLAVLLLGIIVLFWRTRAS
jgi:hypothetical protein